MGPHLVEGLLWATAGGGVAVGPHLVEGLLGATSGGRVAVGHSWWRMAFFLQTGHRHFPSILQEASKKPSLHAP